MRKITTGSKEFDALLGGGIELAVNVQFLVEEGGLDRVFSMPGRSDIEYHLAHLTCGEFCIQQFPFNITFNVRNKFNESEVREYLTE